MSDLLGIVFTTVCSEAIFKELPVHYLPEKEEEVEVNPFGVYQPNEDDKMSNLSYGNGGSLGTIQCTKNSYQIFRELHSPEHVYADTYLMFEKVMELGIKDLYYKGE